MLVLALNLMIEVHLFYQSVLPTFTHLNLLLQPEELNHTVADEFRAILQKLFCKFVKVGVLKVVIITDDSTIMVELVIMQCLRRLLDAGDIHSCKFGNQATRTY